MAEFPEWYDGKHVNEVKFCEEFLYEHPMKSVNGTFFTVEGRVTDEDKLRREVYELLKPYFSNALGKRVNNLLEALRLEAYAPDLPIQRDRIHVANGTLFLDGTFSGEREFCRNRLPVAYNPDAPVPETWLKFLGELLYPEDIPTLQEFMGYCFLPTTKGQKMLMLIGRGGEGKSRIGVVLRALLGANMATGSIAKIESSRFARADLEHELVMLDDDMKLEALPQTNHIKAIVTAELPMDLERKGQQSYQGDLYVRFLGFRYDVLYTYVLARVRYWAKQAEIDEEALLQRLLKTSDKERVAASKKQAGELAKAEKRKAEVDRLFTRMYEDWAAGRITEYNFNMLSQKYQSEQQELEAKIETLKAQLTAQEQSTADIEKWVKLIRQYTNPTELTAELLNTLIEKILIHEAVKQPDGTREQEVEIFYRFVGKID